MTGRPAVSVALSKAAIFVGVVLLCAVPLCEPSVGSLGPTPKAANECVCPLAGVVTPRMEGKETAKNATESNYSLLEEGATQLTALLLVSSASCPFTGQADILEGRTPTGPWNFSSEEPVGHVFEVIGMVPNSSYFFDANVTAGQVCGQSGFTAELTVETAGLPTLSVTNVTSSSASVSWNNPTIGEYVGLGNSPTILELSGSQFTPMPSTPAADCRSQAPCVEYTSNTTGQVLGLQPGATYTISFENPIGLEGSPPSVLGYANSSPVTFVTQPGSSPTVTSTVAGAPLWAWIAGAGIMIAVVGISAYALRSRAQVRLVHDRGPLRP
jgi:hypothetical protein